MPPPIVKTYYDLLCYEYAKLIASSAGMENNYRFIIDRMKKMRDGEIRVSDIVREDQYLVEEGFNRCIYCGSTDDLSFDHLIPLSRGGPDIISNQVVACRTCNSSKGNRDVLELCKARTVRIPRVVWGEYLKLIVGVWTAGGLLHTLLPQSERQKWSGLRVKPRQKAHH